MGFFDFFRKNVATPQQHGVIKIKPLVDSCINAFEQGNIAKLQNELYHLVSYFNKPGCGTLITDFDEKDRLAECFTLCLQYDWMNDKDIREVWAENGFYCIADYLSTHWNNKQDLLAGALDLFLLLHYGKNSIRPKIASILHKAQFLGNPIFTAQDYASGANYVIRQFMFFAATIVSPIARTQEVFSSDVKPAYERAKSDFEFAGVSPVDIINKMMFIAAVIESILNDM